VGGSFFYGGDYLGGGCVVHVCDPHGEDIFVAGHLLRVAPFAGACAESVYDCVEVIHHTTHSIGVGHLLGYETIHRGCAPTVATIDKRKKFVLFLAVFLF